MMHIYPSAHVLSGTKLGNDVKIGLFSIVLDSVVIRDRVRIDSCCEFGLPKSFGDGSALITTNTANVRHATQQVSR
jgi:acyl-[acyl carrier protein]--UDP-N-acetylglucosamine O-acyltransferase